MGNIISTYVDTEVADAIEAACKSSGKTKSEVVKQALRQVFISKESFELLVESLELEELTRKKKAAELGIVEIDMQIAEKELHVEELQNSVVDDWIKAQVSDIGLDINDVDTGVYEFQERAKSLQESWMRDKVDYFIENDGISEVKSMLEKMNSEVAQE